MKVLLKVFFVLFSLYGLFLLNNKIELPKTENVAKIYLNPNFKHFTFGFNKFYSSLFWINTLMDSDLSHYKEKDLKSWSYLRFNTITTLDPNFLKAYRYGSLYLSVVKDDIKGASALFKKGLNIFKTDHWLNLYGAYHALYEEKDDSTALQRLSLIRKDLLKSPFVIAILYSLRAKKSGNRTDRNVIIEAIKKEERFNDFMKQKLIEKIEKM